MKPEVKKTSTRKLKRVRVYDVARNYAESIGVQLRCNSYRKPLVIERIKATPWWVAVYDR